ncbi:hypothetical protein [Fodinibius sp. AD559]|uniref:hypothetical protein n=1 Tax=Fodinibius sp. AD559 TaxID=3424179 RepID=UPI004046D153
MAFYIRRESEDWYTDLTRDGNELIRTRFDLYYLFFLKGIANQDKNPKNKGSEFVKELIEYFPEEYKGSRNTIVGLLVNSELNRLGISPDDKREVKDKYQQIVEPESQAKLTSKGFSLMNDYASRGYELFQQELGDNPASLAPEFLINAYKNLKKNFEKNF